MQSLSIRGYMEAIRRKRINGARIALNDKCSNVRRQQPFPTFTQSLEAALMDWADDITYAVHDLIDFFCAGQIPLERLGAPGMLSRAAGYRRNRRCRFETVRAR